MSRGVRLYIGGVSRYCEERDMEDFFRGYGRINDIFIRPGYAFVEIDDPRDADDAMHDLNGRTLKGERVSIERAKFPPGARGRGSFGGGFDRGSDRGFDRGFDRGSDRDRFGGRGRSPPRRRRESPEQQTRHRLVVENLTTRYTWQDLKGMFRDAGYEIPFADAHRTRDNEGIVCFTSAEDLKAAMDKFQGKEINGREIKLVDDSKSKSRSPRRSRSRSRSRSRRAGRSRSRSASGSRDSRSRSRSKSKSRSRSASKSGSDKRSASPTPAKKARHSSGGSKETSPVNGKADEDVKTNGHTDDK